MKGFLLSLRSEFYKNRKTLGFWSAIILPFIITLLIFVSFYTHSSDMALSPGFMLWTKYSGSILNVMGTLLLPIFLIFVGYSVNNIEHKADTWKTLFSLPISKWAVYSAKFAYALFLVFLCLALFALFNIASGNLLGVLKPELKFGDYDMSKVLLTIYFKLFLSSLGIISVQFLMSLLWSDFLKPMGIGFIGTVAGVIAATAKRKFVYLFVYAHPVMALQIMKPTIRKGHPPEILIDIFTKEIYVSLIVFAVVFIAGFYIVQRRSVK